MTTKESPSQSFMYLYACVCSLTMSDDLKLEDCVYKNVRSATSLSVYEREHMSSVCGASSSSTHTKFQGLSLSSREHKKTAKVYMQIDRYIYRDWTARLDGCCWHSTALYLERMKRGRAKETFFYFYYFFFFVQDGVDSGLFDILSTRRKRRKKRKK